MAVTEAFHQHSFRSILFRLGTIYLSMHAHQRGTRSPAFRLGRAKSTDQAYGQRPEGAKLSVPDVASGCTVPTRGPDQDPGQARVLHAARRTERSASPRLPAAQREGEVGAAFPYRHLTRERPFLVLAAATPQQGRRRSISTASQSSNTTQLPHYLHLANRGTFAGSSQNCEIECHLPIMRGN